MWIKFRLLIMKHIFSILCAAALSVCAYAADFTPSAALDPNFVYGEPTVVNSPDTTFYKQAYSFVESNIRVSCTQGSILADEGYFNCNVGYSMTFEATKPMKGLEIKGFVRKNFGATVDNGTIAFCSDIVDVESDPVIVITDINSTTVTITSTDAQFRCYSVRFYFDENPTSAPCDGGTPGEGETFFVDFSIAEAVYESEISADEGKPNYTIYLRNTGEVPYMGLDLYPAATGDLTGLYTTDDGSLGDYTFYQYGDDLENDYTWAIEGAVAINKEGEVYTISGYITGDDNNTYNFTFTGAMPFYDDLDYYAQGIETVPAMDRNAPMYDILGRKVNDTYKGIVIQNGYKYVLK